MLYCTTWASQGAANSKEPACQCRRHKRHRFDSWVRKVPWRREWLPTPISWPGEFPEQRSLAGYNPWGSQSWTQLSDFHKHKHWVDVRLASLLI